jgi:transcriptional regulator with XRE-family HTH domain
MTAIELGQAVKRKRQREGLSLRSLDARINLSQSTLSRIEHGVGIPDSATLVKLSDWLCLPLADLADVQSPNPRAVTYHPDSSTPDIIAAHLRADANLKPDRATMLIDLFRAMYERMAQ